MTVSDIDSIASEIHIAATPDVVFAYFVDPDKMVRWMGTRAQLDARPGGSYALDINPHVRARGTYLEVVPNARIVFTFGWQDDSDVPPGSTTVEVTLTPDGEGTRVRLVHRGLRLAEGREQHLHGWRLYLGRLGVAASGGDPGGEPNANPAG